MEGTGEVDGGWEVGGVEGVPDAIEMSQQFGEFWGM